MNARSVAGSVPGAWADQAAMIDETLALRPGIAKGIWRTSLRAAPEDPVLSDAQWGRIAEQYVAAMGLTKTPWTATRHGDDHIHLTVSRVTWEGKVLALSHDFAKAQAACRVIETEHHLVDASARFDRARPQVSHGERESAARRGVGVERVQLRELVASATSAAAAAGGSREAFEAQLAAAGVAWRANVASTGRVSGYSYALAGHVDPGGAPVFFKGSQLGKAHTWAATSATLATGREVLREQVRAEVRQEAQQRREQRQAAMLAEHRGVVTQRRDLAAAVNDARAAHSASADALAVAGRVFQVAAAASRTANSDAEDALRDLQRALAALADLTQTLAQRSLAARARERLAAPRSGPARRAATLTGAQDAVTTARDRVAATGEVASARQGAQRDASEALQAAREEHEHTGTALNRARGRDLQASRPTAWEAAQHDARVQAARAAEQSARSLGASPSYRPPPPTPGRGLGR